MKQQTRLEINYENVGIGFQEVLAVMFFLAEGKKLKKTAFGRFGISPLQCSGLVCYLCLISMRCLDDAH